MRKISFKVTPHHSPGNYLDANSSAGKGGARYGRHSGICFETQIHPNAINRPDFPSTLLRPGETYRHQTVFDVAERPSLQWL